MTERSKPSLTLYFLKLSAVRFLTIWSHASLFVGNKRKNRSQSSLSRRRTRERSHAMIDAVRGMLHAKEISPK